ncbi:hypothetical protein EMIHUDRAFT_213442 [Emiliania huxleyi CCMP1516]|uniref:Uncharacterized protein n=2 Tax=Emiliania huxleyi TaxID=2903 RepID=A0A0D3IN38_EMIH1|nr:hypothetical protein EMIHUDRAFT_213442 [Emiliania huxleyi CCMP1516]EOD12673.1 hypothetical protein EMIHUDRAFT_213442 [Emiliania huxleyi CCMP1516]|eukprot:XP_005765102.1 hypothetical protein EMIHUDRAFT_213442 [Emiliania huxleyi CCMP1516]
MVSGERGTVLRVFPQSLFQRFSTLALSLHIGPRRLEVAQPPPFRVWLVADFNMAAGRRCDRGGAARGNGVLTDLNLNYNEIGDESATALASALRVNSNPLVTTLWLGANGIGDKGAASIAEALRGNEEDDTSRGGRGGRGRGRYGGLGAEDAAVCAEVLTTLDLASILASATSRWEESD